VGQGPRQRGEPLSELGPGDALAAVRSFPRRLREALAPREEDRRSVEELAAAGSPSALDHAGALLAALQAIATRLDRIRLTDEPAFSGWVTATGTTRGIRGITEAVEAAAAEAAKAIGHYEDLLWLRTAEVEGEGTLSALDVLRHLVELAAGSLRNVQRAMDEARRAAASEAPPTQPPEAR
jgi:hypothetical protein